MDARTKAQHILRMYEAHELEDVIAEAIQDERNHAAALAERLETLRAILTDPQNQLEQTKLGYYIYRFNLETMHEIADAIGLVKITPQPSLAFYTVEELPGLIKPD